MRIPEDTVWRRVYSILHHYAHESSGDWITFAAMKLLYQSHFGKGLNEKDMGADYRYYHCRSQRGGGGGAAVGGSAQTPIRMMLGPPPPDPLLNGAPNGCGAESHRGSGVGAPSYLLAAKPPRSLGRSPNPLRYRHGFRTGIGERESRLMRLSFLRAEGVRKLKLLKSCYTKFNPPTPKIYVSRTSTKKIRLNGSKMHGTLYAVLF